jgi:hypothetical protein
MLPFTIIIYFKTYQCSIVVEKLDQDVQYGFIVEVPASKAQFLDGSTQGTTMKEILEEFYWYAAVRVMQ